MESEWLRNSTRLDDTCSELLNLIRLSPVLVPVVLDFAFNVTLKRYHGSFIVAVTSASRLVEASAVRL